MNRDSDLDRICRAGASRVLAELSRRAVRRRRRRAVGAAGILAVVCAGVSFWPRPKVAAPSLLASSSAAVVAPSRQILDDGSTVDLRAGASISVEFDRSFRRVALRRGEALFHVAKNPRRPFIVLAGEVEVRAVGTAFAVELEPGAVEVVVTEGRVAIGRAAAGTAQPLAEVDAGHTATVPLGPLPRGPALVRATSEADLNERLAWTSPRLELSGTPLSEAVALINGRNHAQFVIADDSLARLKISGFIRADNPEAFARYLESSFGVRAVRREDGKIELRRFP